MINRLLASKSLSSLLNKVCEFNFSAVKPMQLTQTWEHVGNKFCGILSMNKRSLLSRSLAIYRVSDLKVQ